jgi:hypothetical protein
MRYASFIFLLCTSVPGWCYEKMYVRGNFPDQGALRKLTFGPTPVQHKNLSHLTQWKFHFSDFYVTKILTDKNLQLQGEAHARMYPPPVILKELDPSQTEGWWQQELKVNETWEYATGKGITIAD